MDGFDKCLKVTTAAAELEMVEGLIVLLQYCKAYRLRVVGDNNGYIGTVL